MATLYIPKGRKYFKIDYWYNGKRYTKSTKFTLAEEELAVKLKEKFEAKLVLLNDNEIEESVINNEKSLKLKDAIELFIKYSRVNWSVGRLNNVKTILKLFTEIVNSNIPIRNIDSRNISEFIEHRKGIVSVTTVRSDITVLRAFFNYLIDEKLIEESPINKRLIPKPEHKTITTFDSISFKKIIDDVKERDKQLYHYLCFLSFTGARPGDIARLTYGDININNKNDDGIKIKISKTSREIMFPMYDALKNFILEEFPDYQTKDKDELIFKGFKVYYFGKKFSRLKKRLRLNESFNLKTFRKSFATNLIENGIDGTIVSYLLAHTSVNITSKYYINKKTNMIKNQLNSIKNLDDNS
jgi:integrase